MTAVPPLDDVVVIDLSSSYAGPTATMLLADMGARVIKVERPGAGDDARHWGPPFVGEHSAWFVSANRNKRSVCLDLRHPAARESLDVLLAGANVLVESMNPAKLEVLGLLPQQVMERHPHLVYCALSGFGLSGPHRDLPGYDLIAQARSGIMSVTGEEDRPQRVSTALSDIATSFVAAYAVAAALRRQARDGQGTVIDVSLLDVDLALMAPRIAAFLAGEPEPRPSGATDSVLAVYQPFDAADRRLAIAIGNDAIWRRFCAAAGLDSLAADPALATNELRRERREEVVARIAEVIKERRADEWIERLTAAGVPVAPIQYLSEVVADPHVVARGSLEPVAMEDGSVVEVVTHPWRLVGEDRCAPSAPPSVGADGTEVLLEFGFDEAAIADLVGSGAVWLPER